MKKIYLAHNVCLNSSYDFNIVKNALNSNGFIIVDRIEEADTYIYSGCGVRGIWVDNAIDEINNAIFKNKNLNVIATGCFAAIDPNKIEDNLHTQNFKLMSIKNIIDEFIDSNIEDLDKGYSQIEDTEFEGTSLKRSRVSEQKKSVLLSLQNIDIQYNLNLAHKYKKSTKGFVFYNEDEPIEYITITRGCPYKCSYCSIPIGRGGEYNSVPLGDIIEKINHALNNNIRRILLLGDEIGNYGLGTNDMDLSKLLDVILEKNNLKVAIRYLEPKPFLKHYETIKKYCLEGKIELLYLPIQSGSNRILKLMNRTYEISEDLIEKVSYLRNNTDVVFYTNWMVGFNTETEDDFQKTIALAKQLNFQINMSIPYSERPNTPASSMTNKISILEKENRHHRLFHCIKDMKRKDFENEMSTVEISQRDETLDKIVEAENYSVQID